MKKIFSFLLTAASALTLSSCMNGDYDANPITNNSTPNPVNTGGSGGSGGGGGSNNNPGVATKGQIRFNVNGENMTYSGAGTNYIEVGSGIRLISGGKIEGGFDYTLNLRIGDYTGVGTYTFGTTTALNTIATYAKTQLGSQDDDYITTGGSQAGSGEIKVTSDANNEMVGTFNFVAYSTGGAKATAVNGSFHVVKF